MSIINKTDIASMRGRILEFEIDKNYEYIPKSFIFKFFSNVLYNCIAFPILYILTKIVFGLKIKGKENLKKIKGKGAISISNHIQTLDCAMIGISLFPRKIYYTTIEENFKIPVIRYLIKLLNAIPIPNGIKQKESFLINIKKLLSDKRIIHFYPESYLKPYDKKLREFKNGAFEIAVENNVAIIPIVYTYRNPKGIRKYIKKKPFLTANILEPIYPKDNIDKKENVTYMKELAFNKMSSLY